MFTFSITIKLHLTFKFAFNSYDRHIAKRLNARSCHICLGRTLVSFSETRLLQRHEVWNILLCCNFVSTLQKFGEIQYKNNFIQKITKKY